MVEVVDRELAVKRAGGRRELAAELHGMLLESTRELKRLIESSWTMQDLDALLVHVHKLNGSTRYCGVPELESKCEELETKIKRGAVDLQGDYDALIKAIDRILDLEVEF